MNQPRSDRTELTHRVTSLPLVEGGEILDEKAALATYEDLKRSGSEIPAHIAQVIRRVLSEINYQLDENPDHDFIVTPSVLRGIVARAAIRGATQTVSDIGHTQSDINRIKALFPDMETVLPLPEPDAPNDSTAA